MPRIRSTFNDDVLDVDETELVDLERQGLVAEKLDDVPAEPSKKSHDKAPDKAPEGGDVTP